MSLITHFRKGSTTDPTQASRRDSSKFWFLQRPAEPAKSQNGKERRVFSLPDSSSASHSSSNAIALSNSVRTGINGLGGMLGLREYLSGDAKVAEARQKVEDAMAAEKLADKALTDARKKVKEAMDQVRNLEREALEE
ncbi:hypothetical protein AX15_003226 [Amanita polypyramis BW_CC]|nr:hypothetical protein AX15_003226 [Amanita polypyramis BW_CC]